PRSAPDAAASPPAPPSAASVGSDSVPALRAAWAEVVARASQRDTTLGAALATAVPTTVDGSRLTVGFNGAFNRNWVHDPANRRVVEDLIFDVTGTRWQLTCIVRRSAQRPSLESVVQDPLVRRA